MRESITYKVILDEGRTEGRIEGERRTLLLQGTRRFGEPTREQRSRLEAATSSEQLEVWLLSLLTASSWDEVLA